MRTADVIRNTTETRIHLGLNLDGTGRFSGRSGSGFLDHMLELLTRHGRFDLDIACEGDTHVDLHHTVEDVGIVLGDAFGKALGDKRGIARYGSFLLPMDEALVMIAVDISGRAHLSTDLNLPTQRVGDFDTELVREFLLGFVRALRATLHVRQLAGENTHHIIEAVFKGLGRALSQAVAFDEKAGGEIPSTKGLL